MIGNLKVGVVIPAYNEAASLERLLPRIPRDLCDLVVVVNDCSTDGTSAAARALGATVIDRPERGGPGPAIRDGLDLLRSRKFDIVAVMASNGKHDPAQLPDLIRPLAEESFDLVRGSRHLEGGGHVNIPWHRLVLIQVFTVLFSALAGRRVTDATGGYQAYRDRGFEPGAFPVTEAAARRVLSLPMYPELPEAEVRRVAEALSASLVQKAPFTPA